MHLVALLAVMNHLITLLRTFPIFQSILCAFKGTVSPPERCDLDGVKLEKVHELFQVCRSCIKGVTFYNMPQYVLLYDQRLCNYH